MNENHWPAGLTRVLTRFLVGKNKRKKHPDGKVRINLKARNLTCPASDRHPTWQHAKEIAHAAMRNVPVQTETDTKLTRVL